METVNKIVVIAGHSGSGKSTLTKRLSESFLCESLNFSYIGQALAAEERGSVVFDGLNDYIYQCILSTARKNLLTFVDGLASDDIIQRLSAEGFSILVLFLDTPYDMRIKRMMNRENCSLFETENIERAKAYGKEKSGLSNVIAMADHRIDGTKAIDEILADAILYLKEKLRLE
ncbi:hypothetical protein [Flavonifractor sp. An10]|uniref:hypothetical protein n=1 Tax=Flavonifractor sp. An10 TaxID=1965537 RepID=UPI001140B0FC|nr:hypothetical protein [Flavonifractor sp. An10]